MGDDPPAMSHHVGDSPNNGNVEASSKSESSTAELLVAFRCHENKRSLSLSGLPKKFRPDILGVLTGVVSNEASFSGSLGEGE